MDCTSRRDLHRFSSRNWNCDWECSYCFSVYGTGHISQILGQFCIRNGNIVRVLCTGVGNRNGIGRSLSGNAGVVLLSQILTIISYITAFYRRFDHCLVFLDRDRCLGYIVAVGHFVGQVCSLVFRNLADHLCCHRCTGSDILECHAVSGNSTVSVCGCDAHQCHAVRNSICQCNISGSITGIRSGDHKFYSIPLHVVCFSILYGFSNTELRPLRSRNLQFHAVSADGRVAGIVTVGLAGNSQAVGDLAVRGAVHLHGAAVQRQCHVQLDCGHFCIGVLAVHGEADLGSASAVDGLYAQVAGGVACCRNGRLDGVFHRSLCITNKGHFRQ